MEQLKEASSTANRIVVARLPQVIISTQEEANNLKPRQDCLIMRNSEQRRDLCQIIQMEICGKTGRGLHRYLRSG